MRAVVLAIALCSAVLPAGAAYQVRVVPVKVAPFYEAGHSRADRPIVNTSSGFDRLLSSTRPEDIARAREAIAAEPERVTPITLMVLAIRMYDVGMRDESVFWYYVARDRMATATAVLDTDFAEVVRIARATGAFALRAGPTINGYALCDADRYVRQRRQAMDWVEKNPYATIFAQTIPAKPGDRRTLLAEGIRSLRAEMEEDIAALARPGEAARRAAARKQDEAEAKYCWQ